jgi:hypothetical protein
VIGPSPGLAHHQARWHTATCTIGNPGVGDPVRNEETGQLEPPAPTTVYDGPCLVAPEGGDRVQEFGEGPVTLRSYTIEIPDLTVDVHVEAIVTITSSRDPLLAAGRELRVLDVPKSELITVRRLLAEEVLT